MCPKQFITIFSNNFLNLRHVSHPAIKGVNSVCFPRFVSYRFDVVNIARILDPVTLKYTFNNFMGCLPVLCLAVTCETSGCMLPLKGLWSFLHRIRERWCDTPAWPEFRSSPWKGSDYSFLISILSGWICLLNHWRLSPQEESLGISQMRRCVKLFPLILEIFQRRRKNTGLVWNNFNH